MGGAGRRSECGGIDNGKLCLSCHCARVKASHACATFALLLGSIRQQLRAVSVGTATPHNRLALRLPRQV
jgi:hypothetical protein